MTALKARGFSLLPVENGRFRSSHEGRSTSQALTFQEKASRLAQAVTWTLSQPWGTCSSIKHECESVNQTKGGGDDDPTSKNTLGLPPLLKSRPGVVVAFIDLATPPLNSWGFLGDRP